MGKFMGRHRSPSVTHLFRIRSVSNLMAEFLNVHVHTTALYISSVIVQFEPNYDGYTSHTFSSLAVSGTLTGAATTILSALLIFYRIYSVSLKNVLPSSGCRYTRLLYFLTESSALYAIGVVLYAVNMPIPLTEVNTRWREGWAWYSDPIFSFTSVSTIRIPQRTTLLIIEVHGSYSHGRVRYASSR